MVCIILPPVELLELRHKTKLTTRAVPGWMKHLIGYMCDLMPVLLGHGGCDHPISSFQNSPMHIGHSYTQPNQTKVEYILLFSLGMPTAKNPSSFYY